MKFEYLIVDGPATTRDTFYNDYTFWLNSLDADGWELVCEDISGAFIFKRPLESDSQNIPGKN